MKWLVSSEIGFHTRDGKCRFTWFNSEMSRWVLLSRSGCVTSLRPISTNDSINDIWQLFENWSSAPPLSNVVLLGSSFVKVSSNVVEEFCRDIALLLVEIETSNMDRIDSGIFSISPEFNLTTDVRSNSRFQPFLSLSMMALRSFLAKWRLEFDIDSSTDPSKRAQFRAKSVFSLHLKSKYFICWKKLWKIPFYKIGMNAIASRFFRI